MPCAALVEARSFEPGMATVDPWTDEGGDNTEYFHTNHLGTTRFMSHPDGDPVDAAVYTAFGERVDGTNHRYGYDGAYGYQAHDFPDPEDGGPIPYLHVGARYYDPGSGRFLQRDRIGIWGGLNVYEYCYSDPVSFVDPTGLVIETLWDCGNLIYDLYKGNWVDAAADVGALFIPFVPAGATKVVRAAKVVTSGKQKAKKIKVVGGKRKPWEKGKPGRKKQGREAGEKKRQKPGWKPRNPPKEPPPHTPSKKD
jgi:RHS repeat-associated protein